MSEAVGRQPIEMKRMIIQEKGRLTDWRIQGFLDKSKHTQKEAYVFERWEKQSPENKAKEEQRHHIKIWHKEVDLALERPWRSLAEGQRGGLCVTEAYTSSGNANHRADITTLCASTFEGDILFSKEQLLNIFLNINIRMCMIHLASISLIFFMPFNSMCRSWLKVSIVQITNGLKLFWKQ